MEGTVEKFVKEMGPNSKPSLFKRLLAGLIDMVIMFFFHYALYSLVLLTPISQSIRDYRNSALNIQEVIKVQSGYGVEEVVDKSTYSGSKIVHYNKDTDYYYVVNDKDFGEDKAAKQEAFSNYTKMLNADETYQGYLFSYHLHNYLVTVFVCGSITELLFMFVIPTIKNTGQTIGMLICSIKMFNPKYSGKAKWYQYLGRVGFMFFVESALPYFFIAEYILFIIPIILIVVMLLNKNNRTLHDLVSGVMVIEKKTFVDNESSEVIDAQIINIEKEN